MKTTLPRFYFIFMVLSLFLFSYENKSLDQKAHKDDRGWTNSKEESKDNSKEVKDEKSIKRTFKHYYRYSNLC